MPTLTLDLPEAAYRAALALSPEERVRRVSKTFIHGEYEDDEDPVLTEEDFAAIGEGLAQLKRGEGTPRHIVFDRIRAKYGLRKGNSPI